MCDFADLLRDAVQAEAARIAAVAQRVIQQSDELGRRNSEEITPGSDDAARVDQPGDRAGHQHL